MLTSINPISTARTLLLSMSSITAGYWLYQETRRWRGKPSHSLLSMSILCSFVILYGAPGLIEYAAPGNSHEMFMITLSELTIATLLIAMNLQFWKIDQSFHSQPTPSDRIQQDD